jgi:cysteine desulfurase
MTQKRIYLDYSATTPLRPQVRRAMAPFLDEVYGNPSSVHALGRDARLAVEDARRGLLATLGASEGHLVFTGSGSEADNLAIVGFARRNPGGCIIRSSIEHKAVIAATKALQAEGYDVRVVPVDGRGVVDVAALEELVAGVKGSALVSVMWANNETGVIQPISKIGELCRAHGAVLFSDAVQAFGKVAVEPLDAGVDMIALAAHKLGGPKGVGALFTGRAMDLEPVVYGGGQESGLRAGTENVAGLAGFAAAAESAADGLTDEAARLSSLRDHLAAGLLAALPEIVINGSDAPERLPNVLSVSVPDVDIEGLLTSLDLEGICVSSGSACTTGSVEASYVMQAMGREGDYAANTIRISMGWDTHADDIAYVVDTFPKLVHRVREYSNRP